MLTEQTKEAIEIDFWRTSEHQKPGANTLDAIINKVKDAEVFIDLFRRYERCFPSHGKILELGAGHCWASCLVKRFLPSARVIATDISPYSLESVGRWERVFGAMPDETYACNSYATREADGSVDLVFCFAAAHHFSNHQKTFAELARILAPGGTCIYFYEPLCTPLLYPIALKRVNAKRPNVPEDLLIPAKMKRQAAEIGMTLRVDYDPNLIRRSFSAGIYYRALRKLRLLQRVLPCCGNVVISHSRELLEEAAN